MSTRDLINELETIVTEGVETATHEETLEAVAVLTDNDPIMEGVVSYLGMLRPAELVDISDLIDDMDDDEVEAVEEAHRMGGSELVESYFDVRARPQALAYMAEDQMALISSVVDLLEARRARSDALQPIRKDRANRAATLFAKHDTKGDHSVLRAKLDLMTKDEKEQARKRSAASTIPLPKAEARERRDTDVDPVPVEPSRSRRDTTPEAVPAGNRANALRKRLGVAPSRARRSTMAGTGIASKGPGKEDKLGGILRKLSQEDFFWEGSALSTRPDAFKVSRKPLKKARSADHSGDPTPTAAAPQIKPAPRAKRNTEVDSAPPAAVTARNQKPVSALDAFRATKPTKPAVAIPDTIKGKAEPAMPDSGKPKIPGAVNPAAVKPAVNPAIPTAPGASEKLPPKKVATPPPIPGSAGDKFARVPTKPTASVAKDTTVNAKAKASQADSDHFDKVTSGAAGLEGPSGTAKGKKPGLLARAGKHISKMMGTKENPGSLRKIGRAAKWALNKTDKLGRAVLKPVGNMAKYAGNVANAAIRKKFGVAFGHESHGEKLIRKDKERAHYNKYNAAALDYETAKAKHAKKKGERHGFAPDDDDEK